MKPRILNRVHRLVQTCSPATFAGELRHVIELGRPHDEFYGFNRQFIKAAILLSLLRRLPVDAFVETGTYTGATSLLVLAQTRQPVFTCEIDQHFYRRARWTLAMFRRRVGVHHADSRDFLRRLVLDRRCARPFFYLDAHWGEELPLNGELKIILSSFLDFVIVIDDFKVAADTGFHYDTYGADSLEWDYVEKTVIETCPTVAVFAPSYPSKEETGSRSGWILLASMGLFPSITKLVPSVLLARIR